jgi:hypothetical protein
MILQFLLQFFKSHIVPYKGNTFSHSFHLLKQKTICLPQINAHTLYAQASFPVFSDFLCMKSKLVIFIWLIYTWPKGQSVNEGCVTVQAVSCWLPTAAAQVFSEYFGFPGQFSFHRMRHIHHL